MTWTAYYLPTPKCRKCRTFRVFAENEREAREQAAQLVRTATKGRGVFINVLKGESNE
jgi:hypothetical protein